MEYKSIHEMISAIHNNGAELGRAFSIKIIENNMYVNHTYMLKNFTGSDLIKLLQYTSELHYNTSSIDADCEYEAEITLFKWNDEIWTFWYWSDRNIRPLFLSLSMFIANFNQSVFANN